MAHGDLPLPALLAHGALGVTARAAGSLTRLVLRIHPSVGTVDEAAIKSRLLRALASGGIVDVNHAALLRMARSVTVSRQPPLATPAGKVLPLQLLRRTSTPPP